MKQMFPGFLVIAVLFYALYLSHKPSKKSFQTQEPLQKPLNTNYKTHIETHKVEHFEEELERLHTTQYTKEYIIRVINFGSHQFSLKGGEMEGGFASKKDAEKIACYVLEFSGKKCVQTYEKDAAMFYSSNCAGCHGEEGKGQKGIFPDLSKEKLLGIEKQETFLKQMIAQMK